MHSTAIPTLFARRRLHQSCRCLSSSEKTARLAENQQSLRIGRCDHENRSETRYPGSVSGRRRALFSTNPISNPAFAATDPLPTDANRRRNGKARTRRNRRASGSNIDRSATSAADGTVHFEFPPSKDFLNASFGFGPKSFEFVNRELKFPPQDYNYSVVLKPLGAPIGSSLLKDRKPYTRFYSREVAAGRGSEFSPMIELAAEPPQSGYEIDLTSGVTRFSLSGDRSCGSWSECSWKEHDPQRSCFNFVFKVIQIGSSAARRTAKHPAGSIHSNDDSRIHPWPPGPLENSENNRRQTWSTALYNDQPRN